MHTIGSVELPVIVDNAYITKTAILSQPQSRPPVAMAAAVKITEIYMVLEQVRSCVAEVMPPDS